MIIVSLTHGLGNQMFQYAFGKGIEHECERPVQYDISWYARATPQEYRSFQLSRFRCHLEYARDEDIDYFFNKSTQKRIINKIRWLTLPYYRQQVIIESKPFQFDENVYRTGGNAFYSGFWQHEKYFANIRDSLREEFNINEELQAINLDILNCIRKNYDRAVCLHIRRGDYIGNKTFELTGLEYYLKAVDVIKQYVEQAMFFVFSDDPSWAKIHLHLDNMLVVNINQEDHPCRDFQLMKSCKHFIISNSSLSWWAAWLNAKPSQIKIAPLKWINLPHVKKVEIVPSTWISI